MANEITLRLQLSQEDLKAIQQQIGKLDDKPLELSVKTDSITKPAKQAEGAYSQLSSTLGKVGIGLAGISAAGAIADQVFTAFLDKDDAVADLAAITGLAGEELNALVGAAERASNTFGTSVPNNINASKVAISKLSPEIAKNQEAFQGIINDINTFAKASKSESSVAATILSDSVNALGYSAENAATKAEILNRLMNVLAAASQAGAIEADQVSQSMLKVGGQARSAGLNIEQTVGTIEILGEVLANGSENGTAFVGVLAAMSKGRFLPENIKAELEKLGIDIDKVGDKTINWTDRLRMLEPLLNDSALTAAFFGDSAKLAGEYAIRNAAKIDSMTAAVTGTDVATQQANTNMDTYREKWGRITNWLTNQGVAVLERARNLIVDMVDDMESFGEGINKLFSGDLSGAWKQWTEGSSAYKKMAAAEKAMREEQEQTTQSTKEQTKATEENTEATEEHKRTIDDLRAELQAAQTALGQFAEDDLEGLAKQRAYIKQLQDRLAALTGTTKQAAKATKEYVKGSVGALEELRKKLQEQLRSAPVTSDEYFQAKRQLEQIERDIELITSGAAEKWGNDLDAMKKYVQEKVASTFIEPFRLLSTSMQERLDNLDLKPPEFKADNLTGDLEIYKDQWESLAAEYREIGASIGTNMANGLAQSMPIWKTVLRSFLVGALDFLQRRALIAVAESTIDAIAKYGPVIGLVQGAIAAGLITGVVQGAKSAITGFATGGVIVGERGPEVIAPAKEFSEFAGAIVRAAISYMSQAVQDLNTQKRQSFDVQTSLTAEPIELRLNGSDAYALIQMHERRAEKSILGGT